MRNIRDPRKYVESFWDWTFLNDCFGGTKIRVADIDGVVERNGHTLFLETKLPNQEVPLGQAILFDSLRNQGSTILVIWGPKNKATHAQRWPYAKMEADNDNIHQFVQDWFEWADSQ